MENIKDPLHGKTLKMILEHLLEVYGWKDLYFYIKINCFKNEPSINSSLKFLRKTEWARKKVEKLYLYTIKYKITANEYISFSEYSNQIE